MSRPDINTELVAEQDALDAVVAQLDADAWLLDTPSDRWSIADQLGHLTYFDNTAALAIESPDEFVEHRAELVGAAADPVAVDSYTLGEFRTLPAARQLAAWRQGRQRLAAAASGVAPDARIEWYGPSMGLRSFLTARLMETWAHGQDIVDALTAAGIETVPRPATDRLRNIAQLGVITRGWSYAVRGLAAPDSEILVQLDAPSGEVWTWGPIDADQSVSGPAEDFCLVVTQRRHRTDTDLTTVGSDAEEWMSIAQAFAGGATDGPPPTGNQGTGNRGATNPDTGDTAS